MTKGLIDAQAATPLFTEYMNHKNGVPQDLWCLSDANIDAALLEIQPLSKQLLYEFYDYPTAKETEDHATIAQVKLDLISVIELDCETLTLESDPGAIINLWISQSVATQNLIIEIEAMLETQAI